MKIADTMNDILNKLTPGETKLVKAIACITGAAIGCAISSTALLIGNEIYKSKKYKPAGIICLHNDEDGNNIASIAIHKDVIFNKDDTVYFRVVESKKK